jgi:hypothetical protein
LGTKVTAVLVIFNSILICVGSILALLFGGAFLLIFLGHLTGKMAVDTWMMSEGKHFFDEKSKWYQDLFAHLFNPVANALIFGSAFISKKYLWKDRLTR